jgi:hypothetical protein
MIETSLLVDAKIQYGLHSSSEFSTFLSQFHPAQMLAETGMPVVLGWRTARVSVGVSSPMIKSEL